MRRHRRKWPHCFRAHGQWMSPKRKPTSCGGTRALISRKCRYIWLYGEVRCSCKSSTLPLPFLGSNATHHSGEVTVTMGMSCQIRALTEGQIDVLFDHLDRVWDIAYNQDDVFGS